jgi:hypothetical protein
MISLNSTLRTLQVVLSGAVTTNQLHVTVHSEIGRFDTDLRARQAEVSSTNNTTAVTAAAAPKNGESKVVKTISCYNRDTTAKTVTFQYNDNGTTFKLVTIVLAVGDHLFYESKMGWYVLNSTGDIKYGITEGSQDAVGSILVDGQTVNFTYDDSTPSITAEVISQMSITSDASGIKLSGDAASPGNTYVYGTSAAGAKGWQLANITYLSDVTITSVADNNVLQYDSATSQWINRTYLRLSEITDPGYADANEAWLHAEDVSGITQIHHNTATHKWAIGQDNFIVCRNTSGVSIAAGKAVYVTGTTGARPEIAAADADSHHHAFGITQDTMANNAYGAVVTHGYVKGINTSSWIAGDRLYVSGTAGDLTTTEPTFPSGSQSIAIVIYAHATQGILFVHHHADSRESDGAWATPFSIGDGSTAGELRLLEPSGTQYTAFKAQAQAGNITYTLPAADATVSGYALKSDGAGNLSWGDAGGSFMLAFAARHG